MKTVTKIVILVFLILFPFALPFLIDVNFAYSFIEWLPALPKAVFVLSFIIWFVSVVLLFNHPCILSRSKGMDDEKASFPQGTR
jgi:hypothetical protein